MKNLRVNIEFSNSQEILTELYQLMELLHGLETWDGKSLPNGNHISFYQVDRSLLLDIWKNTEILLLQLFMVQDIWLHNSNLQKPIILFSNG